MNLGISEGAKRSALTVGTSIKKELKASVKISSEVAKAVFRLSDNLIFKVFSPFLLTFSFGKMLLITALSVYLNKCDCSYTVTMITICFGWNARRILEKTFAGLQP